MFLAMVLDDAAGNGASATNKAANIAEIIDTAARHICMYPNSEANDVSMDKTLNSKAITPILRTHTPENATR